MSYILKIRNSRRNPYGHLHEITKLDAAGFSRAEQSENMNKSESHNASLRAGFFSLCSYPDYILNMNLKFMKKGEKLNM